MKHTGAICAEEVGSLCYSSYLFILGELNKERKASKPRRSMLIGPASWRGALTIRTEPCYQTTTLKPQNLLPSGERC